MTSWTDFFFGALAALCACWLALWVWYWRGIIKEADEMLINDKEPQDEL